jgi:hypothetical protein
MLKELIIRHGNKIHKYLIKIFNALGWRQNSGWGEGFSLNFHGVLTPLQVQQLINTEFLRKLVFSLFKEKVLHISGKTAQNF